MLVSIYKAFGSYQRELASHLVLTKETQGRKTLFPALNLYYLFVSSPLHSFLTPFFSLIHQFILTTCNYT